MLDINFIRENQEKVKEVCKNKNCVCDVDLLLEIDAKRRTINKETEEISAKKNKATKLIPTLKDEEKDKVISEMRELDKRDDELRKSMKEIEKKYLDLLYKIPNIYFEGTPIGKDENENKVIEKWGKIPKFSFKPKEHMELGEKLGIIDTKKAGEISGTRFGYLMGKAAMLELALIQYTFKVLTDEKILKKLAKKYCSKPFIPVIPPTMIKPDVFIKMARLSEEDKKERYYLPDDDMYLVGSAEHTLGPLHMNETINEKDLPIRYVGFSTSFRREAGSYGKDTKGILRVHQFDKIEMETFQTPENSLHEQNFIVEIQKYLVRSLKLPYQVVLICTGDMGKPDAKQIDIETWMPGQNRYRETHTSDLNTDYQSRRLNTRIKRLDGKTEFAHMNDATAFAIGRILIAIIENYQQKDGSIKVPQVLQKYTGFKAIK